MSYEEERDARNEINHVVLDKNNKLTKQELLRNLQRCINYEFGDPEYSHEIADMLLIKYIDDPEVEELWDKIDRWYA